MSETAISTPGRIILIILVIVAIILFVPGKIYTLVGVFDKWFGGENYSDEVEKSTAKINFNTFLKNLESCKLSTTINCFCKSDLKLPPDYELRVTSDKLILFKGRNIVLENSSDVSYILNNNLVCEAEEFTITFDEGMRLEKKILGLGFLGKKIYFNEKSPFIYKSNGKFCWVTKALDENKLKDIHECK